MGNSILVLGATGNVGTQIVRNLVALGRPVKAAIYPPELATYQAPFGVETVPYDFYRPETFGPALANVKQLYMMCKDNDSAPDIVLNPFVDQAKAAGVEQIVLMTGIGVDKAPDSVGYRRVEKYVMALGIPYTILRPTWFMQFFQTPFILATVKERDGIYLPASDGQVSFIHAHDIAAVATCALTEDGHAGQGYTLTGGESLSFADVAAAISTATERQIRYEDTPIDDLRQVVTKVGGWPGPIEFMDHMFKTVRSGAVEPVYSTVGDVTGRAPITFTQFCQENSIIWQ